MVQTLHNFRMVCPGATLYRDRHICEECINCPNSCGRNVADSCVCGKNADSLSSNCCQCSCGKNTVKSARKASTRGNSMCAKNCYLPAISHACYRGSRLQTAAVVLSLQLQKMSGIWGKVHYICLTDFNKEKLMSLNVGKKALIPASHIHVKPNFTPGIPYSDASKCQTANQHSGADACLAANLHASSNECTVANSHPGFGAFSADDYHSDMSDRSAESVALRTVEHLRTMGISQDTKYYLALGRLERIKGTHLIVKAFARNGKTLVMAGSGEQEEEIKKYLQKHHITNIHLAGQLPHEDAMKLLSKAEALVICPQWYETFGMNVIEAFSIGIPVISNDIGNAAELVKDGVTGTKCENTVAGLCEAVERFETLDRTELSANAHRSYEESYSEDKNYEQLMSIYESVVARTRS